MLAATVCFTDTKVVTAAGSVAASVAKTAVITVMDSATSVTLQVPWTEGMKLYATTKAGEAEAALKAVQILHGSQVIAITDTAASRERSRPRVASRRCHQATSPLLPLLHSLRSLRHT